MIENRWTLTDALRQEFFPIVQGFIDKLEAYESTEFDELLEIDLSDTRINPFTLIELLKELGYKDDGDGMDTNGWQFDFWQRMYKDDLKTLVVEGTGIIFELKLREEG